MDCTLDHALEGIGFDEAVARTEAALSKHGFGILTEIDVKATMKKKIDADIDDYHSAAGTSWSARLIPWHPCRRLKTNRR